MKEIDQVLDRMCAGDEWLPAYDPSDQYASPFGCESAMPGNYFGEMNLTDVFRGAFLNGEFPETLGQVSFDLIDEVSDVSRANDPETHKRHVIGTARMLLRRWAKGGRGEALCMIEYGFVPEMAALKEVKDQTGEVFKDHADMDKNGHIDFVTPEGELVQVKTTVKEPSYSNSRLYTLLLWVTPDYKIVEIEP